MGIDTLLEEIGCYWGMSNRKFSSLPEAERKRYEKLENRLFEFEAVRENSSSILQ